MGYDSTRLDVSQTPMSVPEEIQLFHQRLIGVDIDENRRSLPFLGEDQGPSRICHPSEETLCLGLEIRGRLGIFGKVKSASCHAEHLSWFYITTSLYFRRTVPSISPYGSRVATKISFRFSSPNGVRSTGM